MIVELFKIITYSIVTGFYLAALIILSILLSLYSLSIIYNNKFIDEFNI